MDKETAIELRTRLGGLPEVTTTSIVHFDDPGSIDYDYLEYMDEDPPDDNKYGVEFYAYDALIPHSILEAVSKYPTGGIHTHPDIGVVCPAN